MEKHRKKDEIKKVFLKNIIITIYNKIQECAIVKAHRWSTQVFLVYLVICRKILPLFSHKNYMVKELDVSCDAEKVSIITEQ